MTTDAELGRVIRARREAREFSQADFAKQVGLTAFVVGRIEAGARPVRAVELMQIAEVLGTTADELLRSSAPPTALELIDTANRKRDAAHSALVDYATAFVDAAAAVDSEGGVVTELGDQIDDADDLARRLDTSLYKGVVAPVPLIEVVERAVRDVAATVSVYPPS